MDPLDEAELEAAFDRMWLDQYETDQILEREADKVLRDELADHDAK